MEERVCSVHDDDDIISVCFFEGCHQYLLCQECIRCHPDNHKSEMKSLISLMKKDDWIKLNEEQRDSQIAQLQSLHYKKECLLDDNQKKLRKMIDEIIEYLRSRMSQWTKELSSLSYMKAKPDNKEAAVKIEDMVNRLANLRFREVDIYNQVKNVKLFNESIMPESIQLWKQLQGAFAGDEMLVNQGKVDGCKQEVLGLIRNMHLKDFFIVSETVSNLKQETISEQSDLLQEESETLAQGKTQSLEKSQEETKLNAKELSDQLGEFNYDYQQKIESLTVTNKNLQDQIFKLKIGLNSLVEVKLELQTELDAVRSQLLEKSSPRELLSESSRIIKEKDLKNIKTWIPNPLRRTCHLELLYRGSRDDFSSTLFYKNCENKAPTIAFIKSKEHGRVFGGYTTKTWEMKNGYIEDKEAFIFSLTHGEKYPIKTPQYAIHGGGYGYILAFGGGHDFVITEPHRGNNYSQFTHSYECSKFKNCTDPAAKKYLAGSDKFTVEEIEVYYVALR